MNQRIDTFHFMTRYHAWLAPPCMDIERQDSLSSVGQGTGVQGAEHVKDKVYFGPRSLGSPAEALMIQVIHCYPSLAVIYSPVAKYVKPNAATVNLVTCGILICVSSASSVWRGGNISCKQGQMGQMAQRLGSRASNKKVAGLIPGKAK